MYCKSVAGGWLGGLKWLVTAEGSSGPLSHSQRVFSQDQCHPLCLAPAPAVSNTQGNCPRYRFIIWTNINALASHCTSRWSQVCPMWPSYWLVSVFPVWIVVTVDRNAGCHVRGRRWPPAAAPDSAGAGDTETCGPRVARQRQQRERRQL